MLQERRTQRVEQPLLVAAAGEMGAVDEAMPPVLRRLQLRQPVPRCGRPCKDVKDELLRTHLPRMFSSIKYESWRLEDNWMPS